MSTQFCITEPILKKIIAEKFRDVLGKAFKITGRRDAAEDCAMMAVIAMWEHRHEFVSEENAAAFFYVSARNFALTELRDERRRRERREAHFKNQINFTEPEEIKENHIERAISKVREKFNRKDTDIFIAHTMEYSNIEMVDELGLNYQTVRNVKARIFKYLKNEFILSLK